MTDSVFAALNQHPFGEQPSLLFLKRSNGQWWLPGGKYVAEEESPQQAAHRWISDLLTIHSCPISHIGMWNLSASAGGGDVHFFESHLRNLFLVDIRDRTSGLSQELAFFNKDEIWFHLYKEGDIPWGQAKMAVYSLCLLHYPPRKRADGEQLRDDLGEWGGYNWIRPDQPK